MTHAPTTEEDMVIVTAMVTVLHTLSQTATTPSPETPCDTTA